MLCLHIEVGFEVILRIFLSSLLHIYIDIVGGAKFLKKNSFPASVGVGTVLVMQIEKTKIYLHYNVCRFGWKLGRVSILYKINSTEQK